VLVHKIAVEAATTPAERKQRHSRSRSRGAGTSRSRGGEADANTQRRGVGCCRVERREPEEEEGEGVEGSMCAACAPRKYIFQHEAWAWDIKCWQGRRAEGFKLEGLV